MKVIDYLHSETGLQRKTSAKGRPLHCCCVCFSIGAWNAEWSWYGSEKDLDDGNPIAKVCSDNCRAKAGQNATQISQSDILKARDREFRDPIYVYREATDKEKYQQAVRDQKGGRPWEP